MPNINVEISENLYNRMIEAKGKLFAKNWVDFFDKLISGETEIFIEILTVDNTLAEKHTVKFKLGDYIYLWNGKTFETIQSPLDEGIKTMLKIKTGLAS